MNKNVLIIGGGIIGLSSAYYLQKQGHNVTIVDQSDLTSGASHVNAGIITPSHIIPLAAPGVINKGLKWMFSSTSPLSIKPTLNSHFLRWAWLFKKASTKQKVEKSIPIIKNINVFSQELYEDIKTSDDFNFYYQKKGLMMLYQSDKMGEEEWNIGQKAIQEGLHVEHLKASEAQQLQPNAKLNIKGAVYYHSDSHTTPSDFMKEFTSYLLKNGVNIITNEKVISVNVSGKKASSVQTKQQKIQFDELVMASGSWTPMLVKQLGLRIPVVPGKGYRINVKKKTGITIPAILTEAKVAVTPMDGFTRFAGKMELAGINTKINMKRVRAIAQSSEKYYPDLKINEEFINDADYGLRPCSPDGLPYIGKLSSFNNVTLATGHAMMGWSLGPATGKLVSELISNQNTSINIASFKPERYL
ncbi:D-amino-acid dehydrogenase [Tenacibaculum sp. MAR_2009_124]|uniref:NAD(P)/FAD-dependent oxidoreductase n=1 Tax=Tenacibaculum sp. MAR_2009_124 TaxID=1250059 RepID=UPI000895AF1F|nr:FAD-dependent oxidoreductase [Tenacibaculum sp. MAR_2009_124]SED15391.1 D-amino-acid dehydrogenase [Tenacibaculum sp. MAR_2009_124]